MPSLFAAAATLLSLFLMASSSQAWSSITPSSSSSSTVNKIHVCVQRTFPGVSPETAQQAWLDYQWKQGGGLLGTVVVNHEGRDDDDNDDSSQQQQQQRTLLPFGLQEELMPPQDNDHDDDDDSCCYWRYKVTKLGWLLSHELVPDSHEATVQFVRSATDDSSSTQMVWTVDCEARHRRDVWQAVTQFHLEAVADNLAAVLAPPVVYQRITHLRMPAAKQQEDTKSGSLTDQWADFVWKNGGGLPVPFVALDAERRVVVPPFLIERLLPPSKNDEIEYTVDNPGLFTYQVHSHRGRVYFQEMNDDAGSSENRGLDMIWTVEIRPMRGWAWLVQPFTAAIVSTICRNFKTHVQEPGATVKLALPRGQGEAFGEIAKDSWLGGVLAAHLQDRRSTMAQTMAIFQPWTWGRSSATDEPGETEEWTFASQS